IVQDQKFRRRPSPPMFTLAEFLQRGDEISFLQKSEIMSDSFKSPPILELTLQFLRRDDLSWGPDGNSKYLSEQRWTTDNPQGKHITANRRRDNGISNVGTPARQVISKLKGARIDRKSTRLNSS